MRENVIKLLTGHIQIHATGFQNSLSPELTIVEKNNLLQNLSQTPFIKAVTERVKCEALVGTTEHSRGIILTGIDPERETTVTRINEFVKQGEFLGNKDDRSILIGSRLAEKIHVALGDKVVVMTQAIDGTLAGYAYHIKGIFHTGSQTLDELSAFVTLAGARDLLGIEEETHEIALRLNDRKSIPKVIIELKKTIPSDQNEILAWNDIVPETEQWVEWSEAIIRTILIAVMVVIGVSIMNTVLMSVFERTRELGVMLAIGTSPGQILRLILLETFILELFGMILGLAAGFAVTTYFGNVGISFHELEAAFSRSYMSTMTYTRVEWHHVVESIITLFLLTSFIGLYPAWKASRMEPVKAIYHS